ncbi:MAG TPA: ABC transporter ATP-binding protein [Anaeromyxobacter sp.]|nr:ABC transporter ATP-binding protein [Anaeromyxobacter sp.]
MTAPACIVELSGVRVERGGVRVLDVPAFGIAEREIVALLGPNGAGKTSLLLSLMALLPRAAGRLLWRGAEVATARDALAARRRMAMILQEPLLFDDTVEGNVASGLRLRGVRRAEARERVAAALARLGLGAIARRSARALSAGEARRVSIARALVLEPEVVLLDEPFANLDARTREAITDGLERTLRETGTAAVLVTHDPAEALRLSDRIAVMSGGAIVQAGPPAEVVNEPASELVASYVGMETVLEGVVVRSAGGELVASVAGRDVHALGAASAGEAVYCCIRPEHVLVESVDPSGSSSARNVFPARVTAISPAGPYLKVKLDCGFPLVASVTGESFAALRLARGREVFASFKATAIHVIRKGEAAPARRG